MQHLGTAFSISERPFWWMMYQVMLGVDRLDMIKGIPQKLLAFEKFLEEHPEWRDKVLLVQIAVPSRTDVPEYQVQTLLLHPFSFACPRCCIMHCTIAIGHYGLASHQAGTPQPCMHCVLRNIGECIKV